MNKKLFIITMIVLVLTFFVFTAFAPQTAQAEVSPRLASGQKIVVTGVQNVNIFYLLFSDYESDYVVSLPSTTANNLGGGVWEFVPPSNIYATDLYVTLLVPSGQQDGRVFYVNQVLYSYGNSPIQYLYEGFVPFQSTVHFYDDELPAWDTLYIDYAVTWEQRYITALQNEINELANQLDIARETIDSYEAMDDGVAALERAFGSIGTILNMEILPNITIGTIVSVPLILGVVFLILRLVRGE